MNIPGLALNEIMTAGKTTEQLKDVLRERISDIVTAQKAFIKFIQNNEQAQVNILAITQIASAIDTNNA